MTLVEGKPPNTTDLLRDSLTTCAKRGLKIQHLI